MIYVVDDDADIRCAMEWNFKLRNVACSTFSSGEQLFNALNISLDSDQAPTPDELAKIKFDPTGDCIILDIRMQGMCGIEIFNLLSRKNLTQRFKVIFTTGHGELSVAVDAIKRGASDFFEKPFNEEDLFNQVQRCLQESEIAFEQAKIQERFDRLTSREKQVVKLLLSGTMNKIIAEQLGIKIRTVEVHRSNILAKMNVKSTIELAAFTHLVIHSEEDRTKFLNKE